VVAPNSSLPVVLHSPGLDERHSGRKGCGCELLPRRKWHGEEKGRRSTAVAFIAGGGTEMGGVLRGVPCGKEGGVGVWPDGKARERRGQAATAAPSRRAGAGSAMPCEQRSPGRG
jgi:hypothetical protein